MIPSSLSLLVRKSCCYQIDLKGEAFLQLLCSLIKSSKYCGAVFGTTSSKRIRYVEVQIGICTRLDCNISGVPHEATCAYQRGGQCGEVLHHARGRSLSCLKQLLLPSFVSSDLQSLLQKVYEYYRDTSALRILSIDISLEIKDSIIIKNCIEDNPH